MRILRSSLPPLFTIPVRHLQLSNTLFPFVPKNTRLSVTKNEQYAPLLEDN